jgi:hypothetical protein
MITGVLHWNFGITNYDADSVHPWKKKSKS